MSTPSHLAAMRHGSYAKPAPPMRKNASASGNLDSSFPPPPPPISGLNGNDPELTGSNSTTPRGSMENLPPPPPHLLHSDEDEPHQQHRDATPQVRRARKKPNGSFNSKHRERNYVCFCSFALKHVATAKFRVRGWA